MTVQTKDVLCNDKCKAEWGTHDVVWLEVDKHAFLEIQVIAKAEGPAQTIECVDVTSAVRATSSTEKTYQSPGASRLTFVIEHITPEERVNRLVTSKHYVAGGSTRLMFKKSRDQVIAFFDAAMRRGKELLPLFQVAIGDTAECVINTLLARYDDKTVTIVSRYASQRLAIALGPSIIDAVKNGFDIAPFMDGGFLQIWFFLMLRVAGVPYLSISADGKVEQYLWEKATAVPVDTTKFVLPLSLDKPIWLAPVKWNQGGYDGVFVDKDTKLVRFIQLTRASQHSFKPFEFCQLLSKLAARQVEVTDVEVYYVVPMELLQTFCLPVDDLGFKKDVADAVFPHGGCRGRVFVAGVEHARSDWDRKSTLGIVSTSPACSHQEYLEIAPGMTPPRTAQGKKAEPSKMSAKKTAAQQGIEKATMLVSTERSPIQAKGDVKLESIGKSQGGARKRKADVQPVKTGPQSD